MESKTGFYSGFLNKVIDLINNDNFSEASNLLTEQSALFSSTDAMALNFRSSILYHAIRCSADTLAHFILSFSPSLDIYFYRLYGTTPLALAMEVQAHSILPILYAKSNRPFVIHVALQSKHTQLVNALKKHWHIPDRLLKQVSVSAA